MIGCHLADSVTEVRDLHSGVPVWAHYPKPFISTGTLSSSLRTDVVIVGAGITGALVAEAATAMGLATVILDRRPPALGSTAASTALLQFEIDTPLSRLAEELGVDRAARVWLRSFRAVADLKHLVERLHIPCAFRPRRTLYLAGNKLDSNALAAECRQRRAIGLPSEFLGHAELRAYAGLDRDAALLSEGAADVDPTALTAGLLRSAIANGCRLFTRTQLAEVAPLHHRVEMVTADGFELEAKALVFATGYELADGIPTAGHRRTSTWAYATPPRPQRLRGNGDLIWEASDPYLYIRTTADGRVLVGGEDEDIDDEAARDALLPAKIEALQGKTKLLLPWLDVTADFAWAGTFGESDNGLPSIGPVPGMPNCYAVLGYGGNGMTFSVVAAQIIQMLLRGQRDPDAELFDFGR
jgi:glycine/D-amino acid oxidase-like deaminating enzyme